jgi:hypothetical protein
MKTGVRNMKSLIALTAFAVLMLFGLSNKSFAAANPAGPDTNLVHHEKSTEAGIPVATDPSNQSGLPNGSDVCACSTDQKGPTVVSKGTAAGKTGSPGEAPR